MQFPHYLQYEEAAWCEGYQNICGIDEAGRGPLAGPVVAGALILPPKFPDYLSDADDSKKLSDLQRRRIFSFLKKQSDIVWSYGTASPRDIEELNIYQATCLAMKRAVSNLDSRPDFLIIDAVTLKEVDIPQKSVIKGDRYCLSVALASIIAKVVRDDIMLEISREYPMYQWYKNKGYPTASHLEALQQYGPSPHHRMNFQPLKGLHLKQNSLW